MVWIFIFTVRTITMWFRLRHDHRHALKNIDCQKEVGNKQWSPTTGSWKSDRVGGANDCVRRWCFLYLFEWKGQLIVNSYKQRFTTIWKCFALQQTANISAKDTKGQSSLSNCNQIQQGDEEEGNFPRHPYEIAQVVSCWVRRNLNFVKPSLWSITIIIWDFLWMSANTWSMYNSDLPVFQG